jgi:hypothetical protein
MTAFLKTISRTGAAALLAIVGLATTPANAVPAFTAKTGQPCAACHVGGFGPQLTPFGRTFKLEGYTMDAGGAFPMPVSAMVVSSFVTSSKDQASPPADHYGVNNNFSMDQASLFLAGGIGNHFGGFFQMTYDGIGRSFSWDNLDLRAIDNVTILGSDVLLGVSLNNNPGVQDVWNTLPSWGFPYTDSALAPAPAAATIFDGGLAQSIIGTTAYAYWDLHRSGSLLDAVARLPERDGNRRRTRPDLGRGALSARGVPEGLWRPEFRGRRLRLLPRSLSRRRQQHG